MAISAIIKQVNPGEDPRDLMLISNYKIQSKQLLKVSQHFTHQVTVSVMFCTYLLSVLQVLQSRATFSVIVTIINFIASVSQNYMDRPSIIPSTCKEAVLACSSSPSLA